MITDHITPTEARAAWVAYVGLNTPIWYLFQVAGLLPVEENAESAAFTYMARCWVELRTSQADRDVNAVARLVAYVEMFR